MSQCPPHCCSGCREELQQERIIRKAEIRRIDICSASPTPEVDHDSKDNSKPDTVDSEDERKVIGFELPACSLLH